MKSVKRFIELQSFVKGLQRKLVSSRQKNIRQRVVFNKNFFSNASMDAFRYMDLLMKKGDSLKKGNSNTLIRSDIGHLPVVVKRYNTVSLADGLKQCFKVSKAYNSWFFANWLQTRGIATPKPLAFIEQRKGFVRKRSYYVYQYMDFALIDPNDETLSQGVIDQKIAELFHAMIQANVSHGDMKITNLLFYKDTVCMIDLDHMRYHYTRLGLRRALRRDRRRLLRNFNAQPAFKEKLAQALSFVDTV